MGSIKQYIKTCSMTFYQTGLKQKIHALKTLKKTLDAKLSKVPFPV
jgi:hypothetical protein